MPFSVSWHTLLDEADEDVQQLQEEIADLEDRIEELTSFKSGTAYHTESAAE